MGRKNDFRPDRVNHDILGKLLLTSRQRKEVAKWLLFSLVCLVGLLVQDVLMSQVSLYGITTDLAACCILAVCIIQGGESGSIFVFVASVVYYYSDSAPGPYCIVLLTAIGIFVALFRQMFLSQGFFTLLLCLAAALLIYEMSLFGMGLILGHTILARAGIFAGTALLTLAAVPVLYPIFVSIGKIGGELWKE